MFICIAPDCGAAMFGYSDSPMLTCPKCSKQFCFNCGTEEWHQGVTCDAFKQWKIDNGKADVKFAEWVKNQKAKECPQCKSFIEKNGGCDHMTYVFSICAFFNMMFAYSMYIDVGIANMSSIGLLVRSGKGMVIHMMYPHKEGVVVIDEEGESSAEEVDGDVKYFIFCIILHHTYIQMMLWIHWVALILKWRCNI